LGAGLFVAVGTGDGDGLGRRGPPERGAGSAPAAARSHPFRHLSAIRRGRVPAYAFARTRKHLIEQGCLGADHVSEVMGSHRVVCSKMFGNTLRKYPTISGPTAGATRGSRCSATESAANPRSSGVRPYTRQSRRWAALPSGRDDEFVAIVLMGFTGMRWGELVGLETAYVRPAPVRVDWQLYELDSGELYPCPPKDDSHRTIDVPDWLARLVSEHISRTEPKPCGCHGRRYVFRGPSPAQRRGTSSGRDRDRRRTPRRRVAGDHVGRVQPSRSGPRQHARPSRRGC
jgi:hypothetical protein